MANNNKQSQRVTAAERRLAILELTKAGYSERAIAEMKNVSRGLVHRDLKRVLKDMAKEYSDVADDVRTMQMERYSELLSRWWPAAMRQNPDEKATKMVMDILKRISEINGVIPDKPLVNIDNRQVHINEVQGEIVFSVESANFDDDETKLIEGEVLEAK